MKNIQNASNVSLLKLKLAILFTFFFLHVSAQLLTLDDLVNIQKSNFEKTKGFFTYKGYSLNSSENEKDGAFYSNGFNLSYARVIWKINSEEVQYLTKSGCENIVIYYTDAATFASIEQSAKAAYKFNASNTSDNLVWTDYKGQSIQIIFNTKIIKQYYSNRTIYEICVMNFIDVNKRTSVMCSNCRGTGEVIEYQKCSQCNGDGKQNCSDCSGKGSTFCRFCNEGKTECNQCRGNGENQCSVCWGQGKLQCTKCYGQGSLNCATCYGQGTISCASCYGQGSTSVYYGGQTINVPCLKCKGKGKLTCLNCTGNGKLNCDNCNSKGTLECENCNSDGKIKCTSCSGSGSQVCQSCKGNFSKKCVSCNASGKTDLICNSCNGKGLTNQEIKKVCPVCKGSKSNKKQ